MHLTTELAESLGGKVPDCKTEDQKKVKRFITKLSQFSKDSGKTGCLVTLVFKDRPPSSSQVDSEILH